jgi:hypothetical protein
MYRGFYFGALLSASLLAMGCAADVSGTSSDEVEANELAATKLDFNMPTPVVSFEKTAMWGMHHLQWHTVRQWDLLSSSDLAFAKKQGWTRAAIQEGQAGNGLEFLAMHRAMLSILRTKFPTDAALFSGWTQVPTNPRDAASPLPHNATTPFDAQMLKALDRIQNHPETFTGDDDFGLYVETQLRPLASDPSHRSTDLTTGLHNYVHNRFSDSSSPIDMGDPTVNIQNKIFWRLHGWIDARWSAVRTAKGLSDTDPAYVAALTKAEAMMNGSAMLGAAMPNAADVPDSLKHPFSR